MNWSSVISSDDVVAIHAVLIPTANGDGEILLVGGDDHDRAANVAGRLITRGASTAGTPTARLSMYSPQMSISFVVATVIWVMVAWSLPAAPPHFLLNPKVSTPIFILKGTGRPSFTRWRAAISRK